MGKKHIAIVTHLEMRERPAHHSVAPPHGLDALLAAPEPPLHFYRYLYDRVGRDYVWVNRKRMSDETLAAIIHDPKVQVYVLYADGVPAGFIELDFRNPPTAELTFLGLMPEFVGRGFGRYLLAQALDLLWTPAETGRAIVQTCTLDHPRALPMYQRFGFVPIGQQSVELEEVD